jgi:DNA phosphorothioation-associated putative methyltransferase
LPRGLLSPSPGPLRRRAGRTGRPDDFRPDAPKIEADVVNLGYVINVIEEPGERSDTIRAAWGLCRQVLAVSAQVLLSGRGKTPVEFGDGVLTGRGTFQKFYEQDELKGYLEAVVETEAIPAGIGTFYLFKDEARRQQFLANRFRRREILPRRRIAELRPEEARQALEPLMEAIAALGRLAPHRAVGVRQHKPPLAAANRLQLVLGVVVQVRLVRAIRPRLPDYLVSISRPRGI